MGDQGGPEYSIPPTRRVVRIKGKCAGSEQHLVWHDLTVTVTGRYGIASATTDCPACGAPVYLDGCI